MQFRTRTIAAALLLALLPTAALAHSSDDVRQKAEKLEQEADEAEERAERLASEASEHEEKAAEYASKADRAAAELAAHRVELDALEDKLVAANHALETARVEADKATRQATQARQAAQKADEALQDARRDLSDSEDTRSAAVRDAYKYGPGIANPEMAAMYVADGTSPSELADTVHMLDVLLTDYSTAVDRSAELTAKARDAEKRAERANTRAQRQAKKAKRAQDDAAERHNDVRMLMADVEQAMLATEQKAQVLAARKVASADAADQARARREAALSEANTKDQQADEAKAEADRLAEEERRRREERNQDPAPAPSPGVDVVPINGQLTSVGGITVSSSIADQLAALLNDARAAGIVLGGYGYRSVETTIRLRKINGCPDVWESPSWTCDVPTARPGTSMHEKGLATDFSWQGRTICFPNPPSACHGNPAFDWLNANASKYGFYGLSSEAWHFSTNGR